MLQQINEANSSIFDELVQAYEEEFAPLTGKEKNQEDKYSLDSDWRPPNSGFYWLEKDVAAGFCVIGTSGDHLDICEFYVSPLFRGRRVGEKMALAIFDAHPGAWQVRQIEGAEGARQFWKKIIHKYTAGHFEEGRGQDPYWGPVTYQRFNAKAK